MLCASGKWLDLSEPICQRLLRTSGEEPVGMARAVRGAPGCCSAGGGLMGPSSGWTPTGKESVPVLRSHLLPILKP